MLPVKLSDILSEYDLNPKDLATDSVKDGAVRIRLQSCDKQHSQIGKMVTTSSSQTTKEMILILQT